MKTVIKKSLSMDVDIVERLDQMAKKLKKSFSGLVTEASAEYLQKLEDAELGEEYKRYYADPKNVREAAAIHEFFRPHIKKTWPK